MTAADRALVERVEHDDLAGGVAQALCRIIRELEAERDALRARCERMEKAIEYNLGYHERIIAKGPDCDCMDYHVCGWNSYKRETAALRAALKEDSDGR